MADLDYILEILLKARDEASPKIDALKAKIDSLKSANDAENAEKDLGKAVEDRGRKEDEARRKTEAGRVEKERSSRASEDASRGAKDLAKNTERLGGSHDDAAQSIRNASDASLQHADNLAKVREESEKTRDGTKDLGLEVSKLNTKWNDFQSDLNRGSFSKGEAARGLKEFSSEFTTLSKKLETGSQDWKDTEATLDRIGSKLKNTDLASSGGLARASIRAITGEGGRKNSAGEALEAIDSKIGDLGIRITGVASALQGFFDLTKIGLSQQLVTGVLSLAGGLFSVASAGTQAGAALAGAFISGLGQAIPMLAIVAASLERFKNILQAVSVAGQAEQQHFYDPTEKQVLQLQQTSQIIGANQQLSNSYIQLFEAQQRVRDSQIALTEARYTAQRQITELANAEKSARLEAEGADISLTESKRQLQIAIQKGDTAGLAQAELAVKEAELNKRTTEYAVPKAEREARLARQRGVSGAPGVISAVEGLEGAKVAELQAKQAGEAAKRQKEITQLQQQARSSKETQSESQLKYIEKGMSPTELGLTNALIKIQEELKSPDSPLKKITDYFVEPFTNAVERIQSLLKTSSFLGPIDDLAKSMGAGLRKLENAAYGEKGTDFFQTMAADASKNIPVVTDAIVHLMKLFEDIAKAADPAFHKLSEDWNGFWESLDKKYEGEGLIKLEAFFNKSAEYAEKFAKLGSALFGLFKAIGSDAAPQGIITVTSFTGAIKDATSWIEGHKSSVVGFFREAREGLGLIGGTLLQIGKELLEVFNLDSLRALSGFLNEVLLPGLRLVVNILGKVTTVLLDFFNLLGKPGRDILGIIGGIIVALVGFSKVLGPIEDATKLIKGLGAAYDALKAKEGLTAAWEALAAAFNKTGAAAAGARTEIEGLAGVEGASAGVAGTDAVAQEGLAGAEVTAGGVVLPAGVSIGAGGAAAAGGGLLAGGSLATIAGTLGGAALAGASIYKGLNSSGQNQGILSDATGFLTGGLLGNASTSPVGVVKKLFGGDESQEKLENFNNKVQDLKGKLNSLPKNILENIQHEGESLAQNSSLSRYKNSLLEVAKSFKPSEVAMKQWYESTKEYMEKLSPAAKNIATTFESINTTSGSIWKNIKNVVKENTENIRENLGLNSKQGKEAIAANFDEAAIKIEESMKRGGMSVQKGMERIRELVSEQLKIFGVHPSEITGVAKGVAGAGKAASKALGAFAAGGYIPASPGGQVARVGEGGHDEVVLSTDPAHAQRSRALLGQYFSRAPHMASGGFVADPGTNFTVNQEPKIVTELRKLGEYLHTTIYGISGYRSPQHSVEVGGFANDPHTRGEAADIGVGSNSRESASKLNAGLLARFGLYRPFYPASAAEINHLQLIPSDAAKIIGSSAGGLSGVSQSVANNIKMITSPKVKGGGAIGQIAQGALNLATKAANIYLSKFGSPREAAGNVHLSGGGVGAEVMNFFTGRIGSKIAAAGITGNFQQESSLNPKEPGGGLDQGQGARDHSNLPLSGQLGAIWEELTGDERATLSAIKNAKSPAEAARIFSERFERPGIPDIGNRERYAEEAYKEYATGGMVGDSVRRLAIRHLRKKVLKFAQGGKAPWGGNPVPIIAHEGERIMNPAQYSETARLAGTSPGGLDRHLGYDGSPRQSFAAGGIPKLVSQKSQPLSLTNYESFVPNELEVGTLSDIIKIFKKIKEGFKNLKKVSGKQYIADLTKSVEEIDIESSGILARLQEGREYFKAKLQRTATSKEYTQKGSQVSLTSGQEGIDVQNIKILNEEAKYLEQERNIIKEAQAQADKIKNPTSRKEALNALKIKQKEFDEAIDSNIEARYQAGIQAFQDQISLMNSTYQVESQKLSNQQTLAQNMGNLSQANAIDDQIKASAEAQYHRLGSALISAQGTGDTELVNSIKQEMTSLEQTIFGTIAEKISNAQTLIQRESQAAESKSSSRLGFSKLLSEEGNYEAAGREEKAGLTEKRANLTSSISQEEKLREEASQAGDTAAVITLTEEIEKNTLELKENNLALNNNVVVTRELILNQIEATGQFKSGIYNAAIQGIETIGKTTGYMNVGGLLSARKGEEGVLRTERSELEKQGSGLGLGVEGMSPQQILSYLSSSGGQAQISQVEAKLLQEGKKEELEQMRKLVNSLETNSTNTLKNAEEIAKLNGQLNQPQSFSTTSWNQFRGAFFGGMGNILPQYASALPPGALEGMPKYGEMAPGASQAAPTIGNLSLTHPVERLDPSLLGEELQHAIATTPTM